MISVAIIGSGNVAIHLAKAFLKVNSVKLVQLYARNSKSVAFLKPEVSIITNLKELKKVDITIIAITDDAIAKVSSKIKNPFVVHTSGSVAINSLKNKHRKGVFYPLQTFSKDTEINFSTVPFCIEAQNTEDVQLLSTLAEAISKNIFLIDSKQRENLHIAAVFVNNFTNHLYKIGSDICSKNNIPFSILQPLINETAVKIRNLTPKNAQTGPAKRNDRKTIENHLKQLSKHQQIIYNTLTKSIQQSYE